MKRRTILAVVVMTAAAAAVVVWNVRATAPDGAVHHGTVVVEPLRQVQPSVTAAVAGEPEPESAKGVAATTTDVEGWVRQAVAEVATHPMTSRLLEIDRLAERAVEAVAAVAGGYPVRRPGPMVPLTGPFLVRPSAAGLVIAESSFDRFDVLVDVLEAVDIERAARRYREVLPQLDEVFHERSWYRSSFHERMVDAIGHLLAVEVPRGEIAVRREALWWEFAEDGLAGLTGALRQLLRFGPDNARRVQGVLHRFLLVVEDCSCCPWDRSFALSETASTRRRPGRSSIVAGSRFSTTSCASAPTATTSTLLDLFTDRRVGARPPSTPRRTPSPATGCQCRPTDRPVRPTNHSAAAAASAGNMGSTPSG